MAKGKILVVDDEVNITQILEFSIGAEARVGRIQPVDIGQIDQKVGIHQQGNHGCQIIVVAQLNFFNGNRIVFIDDRDHAHADQGPQGATGIEVAPPVREIVMRQQHLRRVQAATRKAALPCLHEPHLADRCCCLQVMQAFRTLVPAHARHALGDSPG